MNEDYKKVEEFFGKDLMNSMFPEIGFQKAIVDISAILQTICDILVLKKIITQEEYKKWFSNEDLEKMANKLLQEAEKMKEKQNEEI